MSLWWRGLALAGLSAGLAAASHAAAGGAAPVLPVAVMIAILVPIMAALLALTSSLLALAGMLVGVQIAAHIWLGALHPHVASPAGRGPIVDHTSHAGVSTGGVLGEFLGASGLMLAAHITAVLVSLALWALARPLADILVRLLRPVLPAGQIPRRGSTLAAPAPLPTRVPLLLSSVAPRRGPPVLA